MPPCAASSDENPQPSLTRPGPPSDSWPRPRALAPCCCRC
jgi:hypothetical protein